MDSKKFLFTILAAICLFGLMACAHSGVTPTGAEAKAVPAASGIQFDFAGSASLLVISPVEKEVLTLKNFQVGTGPNRMLIAGVQVEEGGKENIGDMVVSSVTCGGRTLTLIPGSEVQLSSMWRGKEYFLKVSLYYLANPASGKHDITVTFAGPVTSANVGAISLYNTKQTAPVNLVTSKQDNQKKIITKITTKNDGSWVVDIVGGGHKSKLKPKAGGHVQRFNSQESSGGKSSLVGGTLPVLSAGEVSLHWAQSRRLINRLAHVAVEIAPQK
ncbi:MAG: hypothetical protein PVJ20_14075 [Desulfobacterales bacterium]